MKGRTFDDEGLKRGDVVVVVSDNRSPYFYEGQELKLIGGARGVRCQDMTNGSAFEWRLALTSTTGEDA